jgi:hypothetical protein
VRDFNHALGGAVHRNHHQMLLKRNHTPYFEWR